MKRSVCILDFGGKPNGEGLQTEAFQKAIDSLYPQGGIVVVPKGRYTIGAIRLRSHTTLYLQSGCELYGTRDIEEYGVLDEDPLEPLPEELRTNARCEKIVRGVVRDYSFFLPNSRWNHGLIRAYGAEDLGIIGEKGSFIDGQNAYDPEGEEHYRGPHGINFWNCHGITLKGYTIKNTGNWAHAIFNSTNILCNHVRVLAGHDGFHVRASQNIEIRNCVFMTGDDCVAGFANVNIHVTHCVCNTACSAFRFGGTTFLAEHCKVYGPAKYFFRGSLTEEEKAAGASVASCGRTNMLSLFTYFADFSFDIPHQPGNMVFRHIKVQNADRLIHYNFSGNEMWQLNRALKSLTLDHVRAEGIQMVTAYGEEKTPLTLTFRKCYIQMKEHMGDAPFLRMAHVGSLSMEHVRIQRDSKGPFALNWSDGGQVELQDVVDIGDPELRVEKAQEPFVMQPI